jgi:hypothetical protein
MNINVSSEKVSAKYPVHVDTHAAGTGFLAEFPTALTLINHRQQKGINMEKAGHLGVDLM